MSIWLTVFRHSLTRSSKRHLLKCFIFGAHTSIHRWLYANIDLIATELGGIEELWLMSKIIIEHCVHTLSRHLIIAKLHVCTLILIVDRLEAAKV